jgi:hypothetical protein
MGHPDCASKIERERGDGMSTRAPNGRGGARRRRVERLPARQTMASEVAAMGCVSAYRVSALQWYLVYQEELASLRDRCGSVDDGHALSRQEQLTEILRLRAEGRTQRDVAAIVGVSPAYVGSFERRILPAITRYRHQVAELNADLT